MSIIKGPIFKLIPRNLSSDSFKISLLSIYYELYRLLMDGTRSRSPQLRPRP